MQYNIAVIKGDGIGPEIVTEAMKAMEVVGEKFGHTFNFTECYAGGNAIDKYGIPLPQETLDVCKASDSVLLGAVGGPKWDSVPSDKRPERALLGLRSNLECLSICVRHRCTPLWRMLARLSRKLSVTALIFWFAAS